MSDALLERSKIYLMHADKNDVSIYDHLSELILQLITTKPNDALEKFEEFSKSLKSELFVQQPFKQVSLDEKKAPNVLDFLISNAINKGKELLKAQLSESQVKIPNLIEESFYFSRLGIGLGQEETSQIYFHIKNSFSTLPLKSARFFGKIYGIENNYYIVEAEPLTPTSLPPYVDDYVAPTETPPSESEAPAPLGEIDPDEPKTPPPKPIKPVENPPSEPAEERTPNQYIYYVSFGPAQPWVRLPDVTPDLIRASRSFQKIFTGNLKALVSNGYPEFPGVEKHLLRAQLARILHATTVLPKPFVPEGAGEEEEQGGAAGGGYVSIAEGNYPQNVNVNTLAEEAQWVHSRPPILVQGRVRKWPLPKAEGEGEEEGKEDPNAPEEVVEPGEEGLGLDLKAVKGIEEDTKITAGRHTIIPSFSFRRDGVVPDSPLLLKSNFWPGSYTVAYGGPRARLASIYIGYGTKYTALPYTVPPPPELPEEYNDLEEKIDPTVDQEDRARTAKEESDIDAAKGDEEEAVEEEDDEV